MTEATPQGRLWVVRHGETEWSASGRHTSRTEVPLTPLGERQAARLRDRLQGQAFSLVLTSPRRRAMDTCRRAGFGDRAVVDADLAEWDYGADEGRTTAEIQVDRPGWSIWRDGPLGGETIGQVAARAERVIHRARQVDGDVLAFAHGHLLRVLAARWADFAPVDGRGLLLEPATISILGWERETPVIELWNEIAPG
ncbi:MAG TPA: histidine phosphatase family protein [Candidatus Limnocylindrales bacterium]|nr:histidine phosphatase family protein [Candidatus Limnocylindrales bacterium]